MHAPVRTVAPVSAIASTAEARMACSIEAVNVGNITTLPLGVEALIAPLRWVGV